MNSSKELNFDGEQGFEVTVDLCPTSDEASRPISHRVLDEQERVKYLIRAIPTPLWERVRKASNKESVSIRVWLLQAIKARLEEQGY